VFERTFGKHKTYLLNLDEIATFDRNLNEALDPNYEYVVGEVNYGNSHTEEPQAWIRKFKEKGSTILSIILHSSFNHCFKNAKNRLINPLSRDEMRVQYDKFYHTLLTVFAYKAKVKEICIDCEHKHSTEIAKEIGEYIHELKNMSSYQRYPDIEWESLRVRINLYKQMKEQLHLQMKLYHTQRKGELAKLISESI
jgi:hypothetical protein